MCGDEQVYVADGEPVDPEDVHLDNLSYQLGINVVELMHRLGRGHLAEYRG